MSTDYFGKGASLPQDIADRANEELAKAVKLIRQELKELEEMLFPFYLHAKAQFEEREQER